MTRASELLDQITASLSELWLPQLYRERVLRLRTRAYEFPTLPRNAKIEIQHTLLGIELKVGRSRMLCPALPTARYLSVFARLGCHQVAIPYDITRISLVADELESSWHRMLLLSHEMTTGRNGAFRARVQQQLIAKVRDEVERAGAGPQVPQFKQSTKQRTEPKSTKGTKRDDAS